MNDIKQFKQSTQLAKRQCYIPFVDKDEYFSTTNIRDIHSVTDLEGRWTCRLFLNEAALERQQVFATLTVQSPSNWSKLTDQSFELIKQQRFFYFEYERTYIIDDYDESKDYHLNVETLQTESLIKINHHYIGEINDISKVSEYDITAYLHEGKNTIQIIVKDEAIVNASDFATYLRTHLNQCIYILERANDRIVNYTLQTKYNEPQHQVNVSIDIKEVEGLPIVSYTIVDPEGFLVKHGDIDLDQSCQIQIDEQSQLMTSCGTYTLFLETDDEIIVEQVDYRD
ncbi:sugar-binding domain-containing protein [Staphylococcus canis]|uniref:Uncharacterized protein n=1 Tax=Staphylococcus canis TaxID=2724942 RepID=A0ABS0T6C2_9STAP|nr:sugar-binding domain-containing protein [Staphylococcus canis]MBI5974288.1 hypothetical protein [Staphylococcus canis]